ncbi:hypothetical protein GZH46_00806, partial [Fragariocoptes setiger]
AHSGCNTNTAQNCLGGNVCGPFGITQAYWKDGNRPGGSWVACTRTRECSQTTIINYMEKYKRDCNGDSLITCSDYAAIHRRGPGACNSKDLRKDPFWQRFQACRASYNLGNFQFSSMTTTSPSTTSTTAHVSQPQSALLAMAGSLPIVANTQLNSAPLPQFSYQRESSTRAQLALNSHNQFMATSTSTTTTTNAATTEVSFQSQLTNAITATADIVLVSKEQPNEITKSETIEYTPSSKTMESSSLTTITTSAPTTTMAPSTTALLLSNAFTTKSSDENSDLSKNVKELNSQSTTLMDQFDRMASSVLSKAALSNSQAPIPIIIVKAEPTIGSSSINSEWQQRQSTVHDSVGNSNSANNAPLESSNDYITSNTVFTNANDAFSVTSANSTNIRESAARLTSECLECICEASSNCDPSVQCISKQRDKNRCGLYMISWDQYKDSDMSPSSGIGGNDPLAGLGLDLLDERLYYDCTTNRECAERLMQVYIAKHLKDCNEDGKINCYDVAATLAIDIKI